MSAPMERGAESEVNVAIRQSAMRVFIFGEMIVVVDFPFYPFRDETNLFI